MNTTRFTKKTAALAAVATLAFTSFGLAGCSSSDSDGAAGRTPAAEKQLKSTPLEDKTTAAGATYEDGMTYEQFAKEGFDGIYAPILSSDGLVMTNNKNLRKDAQRVDLAIPISAQGIGSIEEYDNLAKLASLAKKGLIDLHIHPAANAERTIDDLGDIYNENTLESDVLANPTSVYGVIAQKWAFETDKDLFVKYMGVLTVPIEGLEGGARAPLDQLVSYPANATYPERHEVERAMLVEGFTASAIKAGYQSSDVDKLHAKLEAVPVTHTTDANAVAWGILLTDLKKDSTFDDALPAKSHTLDRNLVIFANGDKSVTDLYNTHYFEKLGFDENDWV